MAPLVSVTTERLRHGLLDVLTDLSGVLHEALLCGEQQPVRPARTHYGKLRAIGDLLDEVGWAAGEVESPCQLDLAVHGWAARAALQRVVAREHYSSWQQADVEEMEGAGHAGGLRAEAERQLIIIEEACQQASLTITPPRS